jgi:DNA primase
VTVPPVQDTTLRAALAAAAAILTAPPARARAASYLRQRGIHTGTLPADWPLGYAPPGWTRLTDKLLAAGFAQDALLAAGLARRSSRGGLIETFRDRVIFPVHDHHGRLAGFVGRDLSGAPGAPKYLNSPQSALCDKGKLLYGLHEANRRNPGATVPVLVEGPLDVLAITATGRGKLCPLALCGTHLTGHQAALLSDITSRAGQPVIIATDSDPTGRAAALTIGQRLRRVGLDTRIAALPNGTDPTDYLTAGGDPDTFTANRCLPLLTLQVQHAIDTQGDRMQWIEGRLAAARSIAQLLVESPTPDAAQQIGWIAHALHITPDSFLTVLTEALTWTDHHPLDHPTRARALTARAIA